MRVKDKESTTENGGQIIFNPSSIFHLLSSPYCLSSIVRPSASVSLTVREPSVIGTKSLKKIDA